MLQKHREEKAQTVGVQVSELKVVCVGAAVTGKPLTAASFLKVPFPPI